MYNMNELKLRNSISINNSSMPMLLNKLNVKYRRNRFTKSAQNKYYSYVTNFIIYNFRVQS